MRAVLVGEASLQFARKTRARGPRRPKTAEDPSRALVVRLVHRLPDMAGGSPSDARRYWRYAAQADFMRSACPEVNSNMQESCV